MEIFGHSSVVGEEQRSGILGEDRARGWKEVPADCPEHMRNHIMEVRRAKLDGFDPLSYLPMIKADAWQTAAITRLKIQLGRATDREQMETLATDIRNLARAIKVDAELRMGVGGPKPPERVDKPTGESDVEFRAKAEKELASIEVL